MPVSSGIWLSNSVNASSPPAEAPMPTTRGSELTSATGSMIGAAETGLTGAGEVLRGRFGRDESGARRARAAPPGRLLPVFFAKCHHYLSLWNELYLTGPEAKT